MNFTETLVSREFGGAQPNASSVLMFSGGRDSTLAALRLVKEGLRPTLVTISSNHLFGIEAVRARIDEMAVHLPVNTRWIRIEQPTNLATDTSFYKQTCLPCHHAYVVVAAAVARNVGARQLAFGYTRYQNNWPEQTPLAIASLRTVLSEYEIELQLPVADLASSEEAQAELTRAGLSTKSLEQKCSRQVTNVTLSPEALSAQISLWEAAIRRSMGSIDHIAGRILEEKVIGEREG